MATYADVYDMAANAVYHKQVSVACRIAARDILNELGTVTNHTKRLVWAKSVLMSDGSLVTMMERGAAQNATLQSTAPNGPWLDSDIQFVVNGLVDVQSSNL